MALSKGDVPVPLRPAKPAGGRPGRLITVAFDSTPQFVAAADLNGDDRPELIVLCPGSSQLEVFKNDGAGDFPFQSGAQDMPLKFQLSSGRSELAIGPLSGDTHPEIVVAGTTGPDLLIAD